MGAHGMIYAGDCLEWLATMVDASVDHAVTDPPYSEHVHASAMRSGDPKARQAKGHGRKRAGTRPTIRALGFVSLTPALQTAVACELARVTRRWVLVFCDAETTQTWRFALQGAGLDYVRTCAWVKPNACPQFSGDRPGAGWEAIVVAHRKGKKRWNGGGRTGVFTFPIETGSYGRHRVNATEKPLPLMMELIDLFTDLGDSVIDPFAGSATTGVACLRRGRTFAGAELDPDSAAVATERLIAESQDSSLAQRRAGQLPLMAASS